MHEEYQEHEPEIGKDHQESFQLVVELGFHAQAQLGHFTDLCDLRELVFLHGWPPAANFPGTLDH